MTTPLGKILIGTSLTPESESVVATGLALARACGARVELVHVHPGYSPSLAHELAPAEYRQEEVSSAGEPALAAELGEQARRHGLDPALGQARLAAGTPHRVLAQAAEGADLVVLGAHEARAGHLPVLGSTADRVMRRIDRPLLVVRPGVEFPPSRVVVAVDLSPASPSLVARSLALLRRPGVVEPVFAALFVLDPLEREGSIHFAPEQVDRFAHEELGRLVDRAEHRAPGVHGAVRHRVRVGEPVPEILAEVAHQRAEMVVVGTHGRGGFERMLIGSVASEVVREAPANVLVFPPESLADGLAEQTGGDWAHVSDEA